jgi:acyl carrier protein
VNTIDDFLDLVGTELGLPVSRDDVGRRLDEIDGFDSVLLLSLLGALERETGRPVPLAGVLEAPSLGRIYELATA